MNIEGREVVTKPTETAARILVSFAAAVLAVHLFDLNSTPWVFLNDKELSGREFNIVAGVGLVFLMFGHVLHWSGDVSAYRSWFKSSKITINSIDEMAALKNTESALAALERRLNNANKSSDKLEIGDPTEGSIMNILDQLKSDVAEALHLLSELDVKFDSVQRRAWRLIYLWYFFIPSGIAAVAIVTTLADLLHYCETW